MTLLTRCVRCNEPIDLDSDDARELRMELLRSGGRGRIEHEVCPRDVPTDLTRYRVTLTVERVEPDEEDESVERVEELARFAVTRDAVDAAAALAAAGDELGEKWVKLQENVGFAELTEQPKPEPEPEPDA